MMYQISLWRYIVVIPSPVVQDVAKAVFRKSNISARYRMQGSSDISSNYRYDNLSLICQMIFCLDIGEISQEQSVIFDDYRLNYFCKELF